MGADEKALNEVQVLFDALAPTVIQKLDDGWRVIVGANDQLLLIPPPRLLGPDNAA